MGQLKTYKITIDQLEEGVDMIAVTSNPAIMIKGVKLSKQEKAEVKFFAEDERMIIAGPAMIPDVKIYRNDEDGEYNVMFTQEVIEKMVERFASQNKGNAFNIEHTDESAPAFILEHWIIEDPEMDKSRKFGFDLPKGTWFVMAKVTDKKFWDEQVKKEEKFGFSIEGLLGLKLNKTNMTKKKFLKRFIATLKFEGAEGIAEEGEVIVAADKIETGETVVVVDENLVPDEEYTGEVVIDGDIVTIEKGEITEVVAEVAVEAAEDVVEEEVKEEELAEDVVEEEVKEEELAELDEAAVIAIIQPKLDEIYAAIAELKNELINEEAAETDTTVALSKVELKAQALKRMTEYAQK